MSRPWFVNPALGCNDSAGLYEVLRQDSDRLGISIHGSFSLDYATELAEELNAEIEASAKCLYRAERAEMLKASAEAQAEHFLQQRLVLEKRIEELEAVIKSQDREITKMMLDVLKLAEDNIGDAW